MKTSLIFSLVFFLSACGAPPACLDAARATLSFIHAIDDMHDKIGECYEQKDCDKRELYEGWLRVTVLRYQAEETAKSCLAVEPTPSVPFMGTP